MSEESRIYVNGKLVSICNGEYIALHIYFKYKTKHGNNVRLKRFDKTSNDAEKRKFLDELDFGIK